MGEGGEGAGKVDDIILNKVASIERAIGRARAEYAGDSANLTADITKQDSIVLNLQRACEAAIDLAMVLVARARLGVPQASRDAFEMLAQAGLVSRESADAMKRMVGFRNVAVHDYQRLSLAIVEGIVVSGADQILGFARAALAMAIIHA